MLINKRKIIGKIFNAIPGYLLGTIITQREFKKRINTARKHKKTFVIQDYFELDVYWKNIKNVGTGPALAVYLFDREILRFDFFGAEKGHFHIFKGNNTNQDFGKIFFAEQNPEEQIKRVKFELLHNLPVYLALNSSHKIRRFRPDKNLLETHLNNILPLLVDYICYNYHKAE